MDLKSIIDKKDEAAKYMGDEIEKVIKTHGKRDPGSEGEKAACEYMADVMREYCDTVTIEPFDVHPAAFMGWIYISITLILVGMILYFFLPILTIIFTVIGLFFAVGEFIMYRKVVDKLFKKKTSHNVLALRKPKGEVKRRIIYNGHPDAACEWTMNYYFGGIGFGLHVVLAFIGVFYVLIIAIAALALNKTAGYMVADGVVRNMGYGMLVFFIPIVGLYFLWNEKVIVDGANDNLTGCYMGIAVLKYLNDLGIELEHTEVGVLLTGSEEAGLRGAKAFCKAHKGEFQDCETLIYAYDTINEAKFLQVNVKDLNATVKSDEKASQLFVDAAKAIDVPCNVGTVPFGATDSAAFSQGGFRATGITAMDHNLQDYYHTRKDTYDNLHMEGLANCFAVSVKVLEMLENEALAEK